jgi:hypothetical protein
LRNQKGFLFEDFSYFPLYFFKKIKKGYLFNLG